MKSPRKKTRRKRSVEIDRPSTWQLQTAKAKFSEVIRRARAEGPQVVTKQGKDEVVIVGIEEFKLLRERASQPQSLVQFFAESPLVKVALDLERAPDYGRKVEL